MLTLEGDGEKRKRFWNDLGRVVNRLGNWYSLCVLEDLDEWVEDRMKLGIT